MERRDWNTYYNSIDGKEVKIGDLISDDKSYARITGFTKTQIRCTIVEKDLETLKDTTFNVMKDRGYGGGGKRVGGWSRYTRYELVTEDEAREMMAAHEERLAEKKAKADARQLKYEAEVKARIELMREDYENRECLSWALGVWSMATVNEKGQPVLIVWTVEVEDEPDWERMREPGADRPTVKVYRCRITFWHREEWGGHEQIHGGASTSVKGFSELEALASRSYD